MLQFNFKYLLFAIFLVGINGQDLLVNITQGTLRGKIMTDRNGGNIYAFQSIPFGKPPVNELRFKAPQPADAWEGIRDATSDGITCVQTEVSTNIDTEDCLYLNVYTPVLPSQIESLTPVMVWIHGGSYSTGSGNTDFYGPEFILTGGVLLVTLNYRLGIFGGFSIDDSTLDVTGNPGLKDQSLALKWVKDNIIFFGGDPEDITLFGESAGATSVHLQMMSPMSAGYFHKAIAQSGAAIQDYVNGERNNGILLAQFLGIQTDNLPEMLSSLQQLPARTIRDSALFLMTLYPYFHFPLVEIEVEQAFLPQRAINILESGEYNHVPFLFGVNDAEGLLFQLFERLATGRNMTVENFFDFIPIDLQLDLNSDAALNLTNRIKQFYYGDEEPTREYITPTVHLYSDFVFTFPSYRAALVHARNSRYPIYYYLFTAITELNLFKKFDQTLRDFPGAVHADELGYLFYNLFTGIVEENSVEERGLERMVTMWTNFAKYSNPTPDGLTDFTWEPLTEDQFKYLHIGTYESSMSYGVPLAERMQFWSEIYEEFYQGDAVPVSV